MGQLRPFFMILFYFFNQKDPIGGGGGHVSVSCPSNLVPPLRRRRDQWEARTAGRRPMGGAALCPALLGRKAPCLGVRAGAAAGRARGDPKCCVTGRGGGRHRERRGGDPKALLGSGIAGGGSLRAFGVWGRRGWEKRGVSGSCLSWRGRGAARGCAGGSIERPGICFRALGCPWGIQECFEGGCGVALNTPGLGWRL